MFSGKYHNNQMRTFGLDSDEDDCPYTPSREQRKPKKSAPVKRKAPVKTEKSKAGGATPTKRKRGSNSASAVKKEQNTDVDLSYESIFGDADFGHQVHGNMASNITGAILSNQVFNRGTMFNGQGQGQPLGYNVYGAQVSDMSFYNSNGYMSDQLPFAMSEHPVSPQVNAYMETPGAPFPTTNWGSYPDDHADMACSDIGFVDGSDYLQNGVELNEPAGHDFIEVNTNTSHDQVVVASTAETNDFADLLEDSVEGETPMAKNEDEDALEKLVSTSPLGESEYEDSEGDERPSKAPKLNKDGVPRKPRQPRPKLLKWSDNDWKNVALGIVWACGENGIQIPFAQAGQVVGESCTAGALQQALLKLRGKQIADGHDIPPLKMAWTRKPKSGTSSTPDADSKSSQTGTPRKTVKKQGAVEPNTPSGLVVLRGQFPNFPATPRSPRGNRHIKVIDDTMFFGGERSLTPDVGHSAKNDWTDLFSDYGSPGIEVPSMGTDPFA